MTVSFLDFWSLIPEIKADRMELVLYRSHRSMDDVLTKKFSREIVEHLGIVHKICRVYKKDVTDRDDLFQEILHNAWRSYPSFEGRSKFSTWLYRVAINTALHHNRQDKFFGKLTDLDRLENHSIESDNERLESLWLVIEKLDALEKSLVMLISMS